MSGKGVINFYQGAERNADLRALKTQLERALIEAQKNAMQLGSLGATAQGIGEGADPTVQVTQDENGIHIHFGIPDGKTGNQGERGEAFTYEDFTPEQLEALRGPEGNPGRDGNPGQPGADGQPGKDGVSPTVATAPITGGTRVSITDASGTKVFDVMDGKDGAAGAGSGDMLASMYDPQGKRMDIFDYADGLLKLINAASVQFADGETWQQKYDAGEFKGEPGVGIASIVQTDGDGAPGTIDTYTITLTNGVTSQFQVYNSKDGKTPIKGQDYTDGYTPQKYVDYWTADDKAEMVADVLAALPSAEGGKY